MKIVAYYRVSTKKQAERDGEVSGTKEVGLGLQAQQKTVEAFAKANSAKIIASYTEVESGKNSKRPQLQQAIAHARLSKATLVVAKLDRLARNMAFTSALMDSGVEFTACDNPHANRLTIHILAAMAEAEAVAISRRTKDALAVAKSKGKLLGSARPGHWEGREHLRGWKKGVENSIKARGERVLTTYGFLIPSMQEKRDAGESFAKIADWLNETGHTTSKGSKFTPATVWRIFEKVDAKAAEKTSA